MHASVCVCVCVCLWYTRMNAFSGLIKRSAGGPWRRFDIKAYPWRCYPFALLHMTGSDHFNRSMRKFAWLRDLSLSDHGLNTVIRQRVNGKTVKTVTGSIQYPVRSEKDIFDLLRIEYVHPWDRHSGQTMATIKNA